MKFHKGKHTAGWETGLCFCVLNNQNQSMIIQGCADRSVTHKVHEITLLLLSVKKGLSYSTGLISRQHTSKPAQTQWREPKGPQQNPEPHQKNVKEGWKRPREAESTTHVSFNLKITWPWGKSKWKAVVQCREQQSSGKHDNKPQICKRFLQRGKECCKLSMGTGHAVMGLNWSKRFWKHQLHNDIDNYTPEPIAEGGYITPVTEGLRTRIKPHHLNQLTTTSPQPGQHQCLATGPWQPAGFTCCMPRNAADFGYAPNALRKLRSENKQPLRFRMSSYKQLIMAQNHSVTRDSFPMLYFSQHCPLNPDSEVSEDTCKPSSNRTWQLCWSLTKGSEQRLF